MSKPEPYTVPTDKGAYIVTGAASGLNLEMTRRLLALGCRVSAWDLTEGGLTGITDRNLSFHAVDVRDRSAQVRAADKTVRAHGGIAGALCGAGIMPLAPFLETTEADLDHVLAVNLKGTLFTAQAVLPHMRKARFGSLVMYSSTLARSAGPNAVSYISSKGGVLGLMRTLALECAEDGVRVNAVSPGLADTPMPTKGRPADYLSQRGRMHPMGRVATPADIANGTLFLLSEDASFVTGQDLRVEGGYKLF